MYSEGVAEKVNEMCVKAMEWLWVYIRTGNDEESRWLLRRVIGESRYINILGGQVQTSCRAIILYLSNRV